MQRLRDRIDSEDPAVAELARLVRAASDLEPRVGAVHRVRAAIARREQVRRSARTCAMAALLLVIALPWAIARVNKLDALEVTAAPPVQLDPDPVLEAAGDDVVAYEPQVPRTVPVSPTRDASPPGKATPHRVRRPTTPAISRIDRASPEPRRPGRDELSPMRDPVEGMTVTPTDSPAAHAQEAPTLESLSIGTRPEVSPASAEEATLVVGALRALRRDHDVPSAIRQLEAYRRRFPAGELAEEVLALAIEAFAALDEAAARSLADEYLRRFPHGRFTDQAERAQRRFRDPRVRDPRVTFTPIYR